MGKKSRDKGARFEREVCLIWHEAGIRFKRNPQSAGGDRQGADVEPVRPIYIDRLLSKGLVSLKAWFAQKLWHECKIRAKQFPISLLYKALDQARSDAKGSGKIPAVTFRVDGKPALIVMRLEEVLGLEDK